MMNPLSPFTLLTHPAAYAARLASSLLREQFHVVELAVQHAAAVAAEPLVEERGVDAAEIEVELEVAVVEVAEARVVADRAGFHRGAGDEQTRGCPVVGTLAAVLLHAAAELGEGQQEYPLLVA